MVMSMEQFKGIPLASELCVTGLISAFQYTFPMDFQNTGERHDGWEFVFVKQGSLCIHAEDSAYILKAGELVCHKPMEFHTLRPIQDPTTAIILCFHCQGKAMQVFNNKILTATHRQKLYFNDLIGYAKNLLVPKEPHQITLDGGMSRSASGTVAQEQCVRNTLELLLLSLMSSESTERSRRVELYEQKSLRKTLTADIMSYLEENMTSSIRLLDLTGNFPYSVSSIKRIFKNETGFTIIDYLHHLRIAKATQLLEETDVPIETISATVGYSSLNYFSNVFKKRIGKTPSKYRQEKKRNHSHQST